jgi:hypothetical protein
MAVIHAHAEDILPCSISKKTRLQAVIGPGSDLGHEAPVWDIREKFGDATNLLVTNIDHGRDLRLEIRRRRQLHRPAERAAANPIQRQGEAAGLPVHRAQRHCQTARAFLPILSVGPG